MCRDGQSAPWTVLLRVSGESLSQAQTPTLHQDWLRIVFFSTLGALRCLCWVRERVRVVGTSSSTLHVRAHPARACETNCDNLGIMQRFLKYVRCRTVKSSCSCSSVGGELPISSRVQLQVGALPVISSTLPHERIPTNTRPHSPKRFTNSLRKPP